VGFVRSLFTNSEETYLDQMVRTKRKKTTPIAPARPSHHRPTHRPWRRRGEADAAADDPALIAT
jgi:hypothetical protein